ncbi:MAG TPA: deoxyribodipyrimidine photo-lyase [Mycobacteriales bacterium]|nr:deoxyribodipyrimidine photo-lyase [Mycobacteriales bacterium]
MTTAVVLFTRDLRLHDNPALHAAVNGADEIVPLFVVDEVIAGGRFTNPNRAAFLADCLRDLDESLRKRDTRLVVRHGDPVVETCSVVQAVGAASVHVAEDYSRYGMRRERRLRDALGSVELITHASHAAVPPGSVTTTGGASFSVFTPYYRRWAQERLRDPLPAPRRLKLPKIAAGRPPSAAEICDGLRSRALPTGGEQVARRLAQRWYSRGVAGYDDGHDALADDATSRLSPYLHFGCISATELVARADRRAGGVEAFLRQLAWRDFFQQVLAEHPDVVDRDLRTHHDRWRKPIREIEAWREGKTGYPLVDAGMRQLRDEGWMHNRARLVVGSFLTKHLYVDWRVGAQHFTDWLVDADVANNTLNWQWVAGTGTDSRPNRMLNPVLQQQRYDPDLAYVRRHVPEFGTPSYPEPIVEHAEAVARFKAARSSK